MNNIDFEMDAGDKISVPPLADDSLNSNYTAIPRGFDAAGTDGVDLDLVVNGMEYGDMNEDDAIKSGYVRGAQANLDPKSVPTPGPKTPGAKDEPKTDRSDTSENPAGGMSVLKSALGLAGLALMGWGFVRYVGRSRSKK